jgi:hypothetical protein
MPWQRRRHARCIRTDTATRHTQDRVLTKAQRRVRLKREKDTWHRLVATGKPPHGQMRSERRHKGVETRVNSRRERRSFDIGELIGVAGVRAAAKKKAFVAASLPGDDDRAGGGETPVVRANEKPSSARPQSTRIPGG